MKIVIAPDSFKGTLTALEAADLIKKGFKKVFPEADYIEIPMADGGEGTARSLVDASGGKIITHQVKDPLGRDIEAHFGIMGDGKTAVIEMAAASGLPLIKTSERNPLKTTTFGTGQLIKKALDLNVSKIIIGIGGSATVDGGAGMAEALGIDLKDVNDKTLDFGGEALKNLVTIDTKNQDPRLEKTEFLVACDVDNPLIGDKGAARVYGPQKGATPEMVEILEESLNNLSQIVKKDLNIDIADLPGAGAAGGLGGGLVAFCKARLKLGVEIVTEAVELEKHIQGADLVITGEGQTDYQTAFGKAPAGVANVAKKCNVPVIAISGSLGERVHDVLSCGIEAYFSTLPTCLSEEEIKQQAGTMLEECSEQVARAIKIGKNL
ncbi:glycerate kinase [Candidatus Auribacterota bacterium]